MYVDINTRAVSVGANSIFKYGKVLKQTVMRVIYDYITNIKYLFYVIYPVINLNIPTFFLYSVFDDIIGTIIINLTQL